MDASDPNSDDVVDIKRLEARAHAAGYLAANGQKWNVPEPRRARMDGQYHFELSRMKFNAIRRMMESYKASVTGAAEGGGNGVVDPGEDCDGSSGIMLCNAYSELRDNRLKRQPPQPTP